jgi:hypothetical protein
VRQTAALILGIRSQWEEQALVAALSNEPEPEVRAAAFASVLELLGIPRNRAWQHWQQVNRQEMPPTWEQVQRIVEQEGVDPRGTNFRRKPEAGTQVIW